MTETIKGMTSMPKEAKKAAGPGAAERAAVRELVKAARARGEDLTGPDGLLKSITKQVLESALEEEMTDHLGHEKHAAAASGSGNIRNGTRPKTVLNRCLPMLRVRSRSRSRGTGPARSARSSSRSGSGT